MCKFDSTNAAGLSAINNFHHECNPRISGMPIKPADNNLVTCYMHAGNTLDDHNTLPSDSTCNSNGPDECSRCQWTANIPCQSCVYRHGGRLCPCHYSTTTHQLVDRWVDCQQHPVFSHSRGNHWLITCEIYIVGACLSSGEAKS